MRLDFIKVIFIYDDMFFLRQIMTFFYIWSTIYEVIYFQLLPNTKNTQVIQYFVKI